MGSKYNVVFKQMMRVGNLAWPSYLQTEQDFPNHFMSLRRGVSPNFQPRRISLRLGTVMCSMYHLVELSSEL